MVEATIIRIRAFSIAVAGLLLLTVCILSLWTLRSVMTLERTTIRLEDRTIRLEDKAMSLEDNETRIEGKVVSLENKLVRLEDRALGLEDKAARLEDNLYIAISGSHIFTSSNGWEEQIKQLNERLEEIQLSKVDESENSAFVADVSELISTLPLFANTQNLPQLVQLEWATVAIEAYHQSPSVLTLLYWRV